MSLTTFDPSNDFANIVDGLSAVTVGGLNVPSTLRRQIDIREVEKSGGKYLSNDSVFHFPLTEHATQPDLGTIIADNDGNWRIVSVAKQTLNTRWRCVSRLLTIDPTSIVTIQVASYAIGTTGAMEPTWSDVGQVNGQVHYKSATVEHANDARHSVREAEVYFADAQTLTANNQIVVSDGTVLKLKEWNGFDELMQLYTAKCEVVKWPHS